MVVGPCQSHLGVLIASSLRRLIVSRDLFAASIPVTVFSQATIEQRPEHVTRM